MRRFILQEPPMRPLIPFVLVLGLTVPAAAQAAICRPAAVAQPAVRHADPDQGQHRDRSTRWPTTAGSLALVDNAPGRDAPLVARLRACRSRHPGQGQSVRMGQHPLPNSISGWSAVGGQALNPYDAGAHDLRLIRGQRAAVAAGLAPAAIGTETDGSITCPASVNGVVGFKPTVGLVSRTHIVPISHSARTPPARSRHGRGRGASC
jgi:hypothetical protein